MTTPERNEVTYPELAPYDEDQHLTILQKDVAPYECPSYEVIFDVGKERYYCCIEGTRNMLEALGLFFQEHPRITYEMVFDHVEV